MSWFVTPISFIFAWSNQRLMKPPPRLILAPNFLSTISSTVRSESRCPPVTSGIGIIPWSAVIVTT